MEGCVPRMRIVRTTAYVVALSMPSAADATSCVGMVALWPEGQASQPRLVHPIVLSNGSLPESVILRVAGSSSRLQRSPQASVRASQGDPQDGASIPIETRRWGNAVEIVPIEPLAAHRRYVVLWATGEHGPERAIGSFETGDELGDSRGPLQIESMAVSWIRERVLADLWAEELSLSLPSEPEQSSRLLAIWTDPLAPGAPDLLLTPGRGAFRWGPSGDCVPHLPLPNPGEQMTYVVREWRRDGRLGPRIVLNVVGAPWPEGEPTRCGSGPNSGICDPLRPFGRAR